MTSVIPIAVAILASCHVTVALDNGLALTPPMGWLSWERFRCHTDCQAQPDTCISEKLIMQMADLMVSEGYKDAGYEYVNIDDCWLAKERDSKGRLVPDPVRFPHGMKALADYVHAKGLKIGIYEDFGSKTCGGYPGSEFYEQSDADSFAEWGIDFLKMDGCNCDPKDMPYGYPIMGKFLNMTGRPIMYECEWTIYWANPDMAAIRDTCNLWRIAGDITDSWESVTGIIKYMAHNHRNLWNYSAPGGWNDPDMLLVGDFGLSHYQQRVQFGMWAMFASPLFMSNDLRTISNEAKAILLNKKVIAINQDPLGAMAHEVLQIPLDRHHNATIFTKPLVRPVKGSWAVGIIGAWDGGDDHLVSTSLGMMGLTNPGGYNLTDAWENKPLGEFKVNQRFNVTVLPSSMLLWTATPL